MRRSIPWKSRSRKQSRTLRSCQWARLQPALHIALPFEEFRQSTSGASAVSCCAGEQVQGSLKATNRSASMETRITPKDMENFRDKASLDPKLVELYRENDYLVAYAK